MKTIYLLRHGEYENPNHLLPVRLPGFPLSAVGNQQILKVAKILKKKGIKSIFSSPILRTRQTARILGRELHLIPRFSKSLVEVSSPLQGKSNSLIKEIERYGDTFRYPPHVDRGGETPEHIYTRMKRIKKRVMQTNSNAVVFVSHGDPIMIFYLLEQGKLISGNRSIPSYGTYIPKGGLIRMDYDGDRLVRASRVNF